MRAGSGASSTKYPRRTSRKGNGPTDYQLLIKNGLVYDGSGGPPKRLNIAVGNSVISCTGDKEPRAGETIDASGLSVAPGFIDTHSHSDFTLLADPHAAQGKLFQGVTTEINGNCGLSGGPLLGEAAERREEDLKELAIKERWNSLSEYLRILEKRRPWMNFATLAGHGNIRGSVVGYKDKDPSAPGMAEMKRLLVESLQAGAIGLSSGLIYPPGAYSKTGELEALAETGKNASQPFIYATHMRSEGAKLLEAIEEAIAIGKKAGALHVSHIKTAGKENWGKIDAAINLLEESRAGGLRATADRYPYTASSTDLDTVLPAWAYDGGIDEELKRLKGPDALARIKGQMKTAPDYWRGVYLSNTPVEEDRWMEGRNISDIAAAINMSPADAAIHIIIRSSARAGAIFHGMTEDNLKRFYRLPWVMVGSDSSARDFSGITAIGKPHPRGFGSFPRFIKRYTMEEGLMGLAEAIRRLTSLPAATFGLKARGLIHEGFYADMVVFDPEKLCDTATFDEPFRKAEGVVHLFVNGAAAIKYGELTGNGAGKVLRHGL